MNEKELTEQIKALQAECETLSKMLGCVKLENNALKDEVKSLRNAVVGLAIVGFGE